MSDGDLVRGLRRAVALHDGDTAAMYQAGREFLIAHEPHPDMLEAVAEMSRILGLDPFRRDAQPWDASR